MGAMPFGQIAQEHRGQGPLLRPWIVLQHRRRAPFGKQETGVADAEGVLLAVLTFHQYLGLAFERAWQVVDTQAMQLHAAQRDQ